jgi:hypothetical protein
MANLTKHINCPDLDGFTTVTLADRDLTLKGPAGTVHRQFATDTGAELFYNKIDHGVSLETLKFFNFIITL